MGQGRRKGAALGTLLTAALLFPAWPARAADRYPQPVRVGDLIGRGLIGPTEAQPLLGHVEAVAVGPEGSTTLRIRTWSWWPWGGRRVLVPAAAVSLLGEHVALTGLDAAAIGTLPDAAPLPSLPDAATISVGLVRPFH